MELLCRACCFCCIKFTKVNRKPGGADFLGGDGEEEGGEGGEGAPEKKNSMNEQALEEALDMEMEAHGGKKDNRHHD